MKKLLVLAYDFPPYISVGGLRPYSWFKYLKEFDIHPIIVTRQWNNTHGSYLDYVSAGDSEETLLEDSQLGEIIRTPYNPNYANRLLLKYGDKKFSLLRKTFSAYYEFVQYIKPVGPKVGLYKGAREYLKNNKVDAIIATGDPFVLFSYAEKLSKEFGIPWIADYRDPWSQNFSAKKSYFSKKIEYYFEKKSVETADSITTVDLLFKLKLLQLFPTKQINIISNGYDPFEMEKIKNSVQDNNLLTFSFIGTIYKWHPLDLLLESFSNYAKKFPGHLFLIKFYGVNNQKSISNKINNQFPLLMGKVSFLPKLDNGELLKKVSQDNVLLLFNYYNFTGTKIYDYLGMRRLILLCFEQDTNALKLKNEYYFKKIETTIFPQIDIINETNSGIIVKDTAHLMEVLKELYEEFQTTGQIACKSSGVEKYSRKIQVEKLAKLIKGI